jgi:hypothetical protein
MQSPVRTRVKAPTSCSIASTAAQDEVSGLLRGVDGFVSYTTFRVDGGGVTVTVCQNKAGTDQSAQVARDWVAANASDVGVGAPVVTEGQVGIHIT